MDIDVKSPVSASHVQVPQILFCCFGLLSVSRAKHRNNHRSRKWDAWPRETVPSVGRFHCGTAKGHRAKARSIRIARRDRWERADRLGGHESRTRSEEHTSELQSPCN